MTGRAGVKTPGSPAERLSPAVVLTRPAGQADDLAHALAHAGIAPIHFPLLEIAPVADDGPLRAALARLGAYDIVVFVSPNAVSHALRHMTQPWPAQVAAAVVGPGSAAALAAHDVMAPGCRIIQPAAGPQARFDSEALLAQLNPSALAGRKVLLVRGDGGRELLADTLQAAGVQVDIVSAYTRQCPVPEEAAWHQVDQLLEQGRPHAWLLTSSEAVRNLDALAVSHYAAPALRKLLQSRCFAPHERIVRQARAAGFVSITLCGAGDGNILQALQLWADPFLAKHDDQ